MKTKKVHHQPSWRMATHEVEAWLSVVGGQLGPVTFNLKGRKVQPYSVAPWAGEKTAPEMPPMLKVLRGDFFCMPFGGNQEIFQEEKHPPHGETANRRWKLESYQENQKYVSLHASLKTSVRRGLVDKRIYLNRGQHAIYSRHIISGMKGPMNLGHHAMLKFPSHYGSGRISTSQIIFGQVAPEMFEFPEQGGYSWLQPGAVFDSLEHVPTLTGQSADLSHFPARRGFEDLVMLVNDPREDFAWTAVAFPAEGFVWFALKDPRILRQTILWISNGGRHYPPWNGRHVEVMGLEEVTSYFHYGLARSAQPNSISRKGFPTCLNFSSGRTVVINYIMAVEAIPKGFDRVASIHPGRRGTVELVSDSGKKVVVPIDLGFLGNPNGQI